MLTFGQLTLQCYHHSLTQFHSPPSKFIQNQESIHHLSHKLYARCHHPWKYISNASENQRFFDKPLYFHRFERQNNAVGNDTVLSLHWKDICFETGFSLAVFQDKKIRVCRTRASFHGQCKHNRKERGPPSMVRNVLLYVATRHHLNYNGQKSKKTTCKNMILTYLWPWNKIKVIKPGMKW